MYKRSLNEKQRTIKDLIKEKDYDYVSYRITLPGDGDIFAGCFKTKGGKIIPLDGDIYSEDEEILRYEEWKLPEKGIKTGLTVIVKGNGYLDEQQKFAKR